MLLYACIDCIEVLSHFRPSTSGRPLPPRSHPTIHYETAINELFVSQGLCERMKTAIERMQWINERINKLTDEFAIVRMNESNRTKERTHEWTSDRTNERVNERNERMNGWITERKYEWRLNELTKKQKIKRIRLRMKEWTKEWMSERMNELISPWTI